MFARFCLLAATGAWVVIGLGVLLGNFERVTQVVFVGLLLVSWKLRSRQAWF